MNDMDKLVEYIRILNDYQHGNYKLKDEEAKILNTLNKSSDLKTQIEINKINNMSFRERDQYVSSLLEKKDATEKKASSVEEEIALTFGVDTSSIKSKRLKDGKELYIFFDNKLGRNVVLENGNGHSIVQELEDVRKENQNEADEYSESTLEHKRVHEGLEVSFIPISEIGNHMSEIAAFNEEKRRNLKFLIDMAPHFGIVAINLENVVGMDSNGNIFEVYFDKIDNKPKINKVDEDGPQKEAEPVKPELEEETKKDQLNEMLSDQENNKPTIEEGFEKKESSSKVLERELPQIPQNQNEE